MLQADQLGTGVDADVVAHRGPRVVDRSQRVDGPAGAVQRQRELLASSLAVRRRGHGVDQAGDELGGRAGVQLHVHEQLLEVGEALVETHAGGDEQRFVGQRPEWAAATEPHCLFGQRRPGGGRPPVAQVGIDLSCQPLEAVHVHVVGIGVEHVAVVAPAQRRAAGQRPAQMLDA